MVIIIKLTIIFIENFKYQYKKIIYMLFYYIKSFVCNHFVSDYFTP